MRTPTEERGIALIATLMMLLLVSTLLIGFTAIVMSDMRSRGIDHDRGQAFYAASAGLEKLTADLGNLYFVNVAPTATQITALTSYPPSISGVQYLKADNTSGYQITASAPVSQTISAGAYQGLMALVTTYTMDVTARTATGGEVHLQRQTETVAIPVFQFGMFSDVDLSFFAGPNFDFGGRVHTNGNLFLSEGNGATLTLRDKVTVVKEVIRQRLQNGVSIDTPGAHAGDVNMATSTNAFRLLARTEGSVVDGVNSALNDPTWHTISLSTYNSYIRNGRTGAKQLNLPLITMGGTNNDLVKRPLVNENINQPEIFGERDFSKVSLRILLSDTAADITSLPTVTGAPAPVSLEAAAWPPANYNPPGNLIDVNHPPIAASAGTVTTTTLGATAGNNPTINTIAGGTLPFPTAGWLLIAGQRVSYTGTFGGSQFTGVQGNAAAIPTLTPINTYYLSTAAVGTIGGFIKIELQNNAGVWSDVTMQILAHGIAARNLVGGACPEPNPNAIIRLQRVRDRADQCAAGGGAVPLATEYWPQTLFDPREGLQRDLVGGATVPLGGVIHYVSIDIGNLSNWFRGVGAYVGQSGPTAFNTNGYSVYFSDRRNNRNANSLETGEYGFEDVVNPADVNGAPNGQLDAGEDVNASGALDSYGQFPSYNGVASTAPPGAAAPLTVAARPTTLVDTYYAQSNRALLFRRALKLTNAGGLNTIIRPGLTIASENPVYIQGDWNADGVNQFNGAHSATSVIADAVTLLSNAWSDLTSFAQPYNPGARVRNVSWYRLAIIAGKGLSFPQPNGTATDFGTDGGAHNFLRYLESGSTLNYQGSIATFYYNRQAVGTYKCCTTVYGPPVRAYAFDLDFLDPTKLPPLTPVFRDLNTIGFSIETRPGK